MESAKKLEQELKDIRGRIRGAEKDLANSKLDSTERNNLREQLAGMISYERSLAKRVEDAKRRESEDK